MVFLPHASAPCRLVWNPSDRETLGTNNNGQDFMHHELMSRQLILTSLLRTGSISSGHGTSVRLPCVVALLNISP
jgi:hypothetical protein